MSIVAVGVALLVMPGSLGGLSMAACRIVWIVD